MPVAAQRSPQQWLRLRGGRASYLCLAEIPSGRKIDFTVVLAPRFEKGFGLG
jgi:hypothetical protein